MNKSTITKVMGEFENSPYVTDLKLDRKVAFIMHISDKIRVARESISSQKRSPNVRLGDMNSVEKQLDELEALVAGVISGNKLHENQTT